jgi:hypothetical protein
MAATSTRSISPPARMVSKTASSVRLRRAHKSSRLDTSTLISAQRGEGSRHIHLLMPPQPYLVELRGSEGIMPYRVNPLVSAVFVSSLAGRCPFARVGPRGRLANALESRIYRSIRPATGTITSTMCIIDDAGFLNHRRRQSIRPLLLTACRPRTRIPNNPGFGVSLRTWRKPFPSNRNKAAYNKAVSRPIPQNQIRSWTTQS